MYVDIVGALLVESFGGKPYCLTMVNVLNWYLRADLSRSKAKVAENIYNFMACVDRNAEYKTRRVHCDKDSKSLTLVSGLRKLGMEFTTRSFYTSESNGLLKRTNRSPINMIRSSLSYAGMADQY